MSKFDSVSCFRPAVGRWWLVSVWKVLCFGQGASVADHDRTMHSSGSNWALVECRVIVLAAKCPRTTFTTVTLRCDVIDGVRKHSLGANGGPARAIGWQPPMMPPFAGSPSSWSVQNTHTHSQDPHRCWLHEANGPRTLAHGSC